MRRGAPLPPIGGIARWWLEIDPATTKRSIYEEFVAGMAVPRRHVDFDRYLRVRDACAIPGTDLPPPIVVEGMTPLLLQVGSTRALEIAAFTPVHPQNLAKLQELVTGGAARAMARHEIPLGARPTDEMILHFAPALANAPGTVFDRIYGGEDLARPKDNALGIAWALGPLRQAALLWCHLAAASRQSAGEIRAGMRRLAMLDRELASRGAVATDARAMGDALEEIAFEKRFAHLKPAARAVAARMLQLKIRHLRMYASRNDPDGSLGIAAMVPVQHPGRLEFARRVESVFAELGKIGREQRKERADRAADQYARLLDIAALRTEAITQTQSHANAAVAELRSKLAARAERAAAAARGARVPNDKTDDGEDFVEFGVLTTVMTPKGRLLAGSQTCWWRAWRERDLWRDLGKRQRKVTRNGDPSLFLRLKEIDADPEAYTGIVFEWRGSVPEAGASAIDPWFVTISNRGVLSPPTNLTPKQRRLRHQLIVDWKLPASESSTAGLLNFDRERNTLWRHTSSRHRFVVPIDEFAFAMRFAELGLNTVNESLCRNSEFLQMRQDKAMWPTSGETGREEVSFLSIPKQSRYQGPMTAIPFQVEQVTFVEATALAREIARRDGHADGLLPEIGAAQTLIDKYPEPQAWIFQSGGQAIGCGSMNRILLGNVVDVTFHELRHAAANAARQAGVPEEAIQRLMNHRTIQQTRYYFRRSQAQRLRQQIGRARRMKTRSATKRATGRREATA